MIIDVLNDLQFEDEFKKHRKNLLIVFSSPDVIDDDVKLKNLLRRFGLEVRI